MTDHAVFHPRVRVQYAPSERALQRLKVVFRDPDTTSVVDREAVDSQNIDVVVPIDVIRRTCRRLVHGARRFSNSMARGGGGGGGDD